LLDPEKMKLDDCDQKKLVLIMDSISSGLDRDILLSMLHV